MPWDAADFADRHNKKLHGASAVKAASMATAMVREGVPEGMAIATANKHGDRMLAHTHRGIGGSLGHSDPLGNLAKPMPIHIGSAKGIGGSSGMGGGQQPQKISGSQQSPWWTRSEARTDETHAPLHFDDGGDVPMSEASPWWERSEAQINDVPFHGGLIGGSGAGRTDRLPLAVGAESHVIPADVVSALGQGATAHGGRILQGVLGGGVGPFDTKLPTEIHGHGVPHAPSVPRGAIEEKAGGEVKPVSILAASAEYVVPPHEVAALGQRAIESKLAKKGEGSMEAGHRLLDEMIARVRDYQINWLKTAPKPKKSIGGAV